MAFSNRSSESNNDSITRLIESARSGSADALGKLFERFRPYLLQVAFEELDSDLRAKESASDLVQKSFMEASAAFGNFQGSEPDILQGWLRQILLNNVRDVRDHYRTDKRQIAREVEQVENVAGSFAVNVTPPSDAVIRQEQAAALEAAMAKLDPTDRQLIAWRHQEGRTFAQIAKALGSTEDAARKRWARAIEELRRLIEEDSSGLRS